MTREAITANDGAGLGTILMIPAVAGMMEAARRLDERRASDPEFAAKFTHFFGVELD